MYRPLPLRDWVPSSPGDESLKAPPNLTRVGFQSTGDAEKILKLHAAYNDKQAPAEDSQTVGKAPTIFRALLGNPELLFYFAKHLEIDDIVALYAISKDFHTILNKKFASFILSICETRAPSASTVFRFKAYKALCMPDPAGNPNVEVKGAIRSVPGFPWLKMVIHREETARGILRAMAYESHRMPRGTLKTIQLLWMLMELPSNAKRIGIMNNRQIWTDRDLLLAMTFFIKLDMLCTDPVDGDGQIALRTVFLSQRGLTPLAMAILHPHRRTRLRAMQHTIWWLHRRGLGFQHYPLFGVSAEEIGCGWREGFGKGNLPLLKVDELIMRTSIARGLRIERLLEDMMLWGYLKNE